ncbi:DUF2690 domain-containing protein [Microbacterium sp. BWT-B31]|uniref:DUF2690 domain-containing protein n=1 Tax=Microbacterium sp. BWT-B31 TaxID=3232072 RepID=UPI003529C9C9
MSGDTVHSTDTTDTTESSADDGIALFAADLRRLRLEADSPTLTKLQSGTGISRSVLSDAFAGRQLPSARTVDGIVRACGADPRSWVDRRDALAAASDVNARGRTNPAPDGDTGADAVGDTPADEPGLARTVASATAAWLAVGAFALGAALTAASFLGIPHLIPKPDDAPLIAVANGEDPAKTPCVEDAAVVSGDTRADNSLLEIIWSDKCQAGWGRITRYDGLGAGNTVTIAIYPATSPHGPDRQEATEHDVQGAYTTLVVRPTPDTLLCAEGSFTVDGTRIDLGDPMCI